MKLKKIVSLALAGILAVSMLAGCGNNSDSNNNNVVPTPSTSIVDAVNNGQDASNKVKVTFTSDADLQDALETAIAMKGIDVEDKHIKNLIPEDFVATNKIWTADSYPGKNSLDIDGEKQTVLVLYTIDDVNTEKAALNKAAYDINEDLSNLVAKSKDEDGNDKIASGNKYYVFDYEGSVAMVSVELSNGTTQYFVAGVLTQTATEKKAA